MLFGDKELQERVLLEAHEFAEKNDIKLIFGAMVGSISQGFQYADSDYDTRFLFLRRDFPEKICIPSEMTEKELVLRYYPVDKVYEWIPFWEATSFLQFLYRPSFKNDFSVGLYNIVGWTFLSPYVWDPYGLQNRLVPLMNRIFRPDYEISYHRKVIAKYRVNLNQDHAVAKEYLYALHAAATIEWCLRFNEQPPVYFETLLYGLGRSALLAEAQKLLMDARSVARATWQDGVSKLQSLHFNILSPLNELLLAYIDEMTEKANSFCSKTESISSHETSKKLIDQMYKIIFDAVFCNEPLRYGDK